MTCFEAATAAAAAVTDGSSLGEAVNHATYILAAAATDVSRGGAVVEQIPYVPADDVADFDKILLGSAACVGAYAWAAYEFGSVS